MARASGASGTIGKPFDALAFKTWVESFLA
jgi:hypothetical protein